MSLIEEVKEVIIADPVVSKLYMSFADNVIVSLQINFKFSGNRPFNVFFQLLTWTRL